jgi:hypothetical protein
VHLTMSVYLAVLGLDRRRSTISQTTRAGIRNGCPVDLDLVSLRLGLADNNVNAGRSGSVDKDLHSGRLSPRSSSSCLSINPAARWISVALRAKLTRMARRPDSYYIELETRLDSLCPLVEELGDERLVGSYREYLSVGEYGLALEIVAERLPLEPDPSRVVNLAAGLLPEAKLMELDGTVHTLETILRAANGDANAT